MALCYIRALTNDPLFFLKLTWFQFASKHFLVLSHDYNDMWEKEMDLVVHDLKRDERVRTKGQVIRKACN
jgi:hypothetical protein